MAARTLQGMVAEIRRNLGNVPVFLTDISKALDDAHKEVSGAWDWPWLLAEFCVRIQPGYSTGTINVTDGTATITGVGTVWDVNWRDKRIRLGGNNYDYIISSVTNPTTIVLDHAVNLGANIVGGTYSIVQDVYAMPADFEPGRDILLVNPQIRYTITHIPRAHLEQQSVLLSSFGSNVQFAYADYGYDETNSCHRIRFVPAPSQAGEYRLIYRRRPTELATMAQKSVLPIGYDDIIVLMAEAMVRRNQGMPGYQELWANATRKLRAMRRQMEGSNTVYSSASQSSGGLPDSSITWQGLSILPTP